MIIKNALLKDGIFDICIDNGIFAKKSTDDVILDANGRKVIPGLVDTHIHGFCGVDVSDLKLNEMSVALAKAGTTCWTPTTMTYPFNVIKEITEQSIETDGAIIAGFHLEGPYISKKKKLTVPIQLHNELLYLLISYLSIATGCQVFTVHKNVDPIVLRHRLSPALPFNMLFMF